MRWRVGAILGGRMGSFQSCWSLCMVSLKLALPPLELIYNLLEPESSTVFYSQGCS